jgi:hypothetical protein
MKVHGYYWRDTILPKTAVNVISVDAPDKEQAMETAQMLLRNGCGAVEVDWTDE